MAQVKDQRPQRRSEAIGGAATEALACLDALDRDTYLSDGALMAALDPLRPHPVVEVRCSPPPRGDHRLGFAALDQQDASVLLAARRVSPKQRRGGLHDLMDVIRPGPLGRRLQGWVEDAEAGRGSIAVAGYTPGDPSGWPLRYRFTCRRCKTERVLTNLSLLRLLLDALRRKANALYVA